MNLNNVARTAIRRNAFQLLRLTALSLDEEDKYIHFLHSMIRFAVKVLALLMMLTVLWCVGDVVVVI
jgi:hypothetical protein